MDVRIDRLRLQVAGMNADMASEFGRLVADRLGTAIATAPRATAPSASGPARLPSLNVTVHQPAAPIPASLAAAIATEISRALSVEAAT